MEDILKTKEKWLTIGSTGKGPLIFPYYAEQFDRRRMKLKIPRKILVADTPLGRKHYQTLKNQKFINLKFLPKEMKNIHTIWVYGNKVVIILVSEEYPIATLIENREIADNYRGYFTMLWKLAKK